MPGDELHDEAPRAASGPRHAAPRKPLLTRLHVPRGRVAAIAAMPTAVLMSMGLSPQLAIANPQSQNPFSDGPCVSMPDQEAEEEAQQERKEAQDAAARKAADEAAAVAEERAEKERAEDARREAARKAQAAAEARRRKAAEAAEEERKATREQAGEQEEVQGGAQEAEPEPEPSPSESERNPWDPLGLGEKFRDWLGGGEDEKAEEPATEHPAREEKAEQDQGSAPSSPVEETGERARDTTDQLTEGLEDTAEKAGEAAHDAREGVEDAARGEDDQRTDGEGTDRAAPSAGGTDEQGKKPFPCVEEKKSAGTDEQTPVVLPNQPWFLESSALTLRGLKYHGVMNVTMMNGQTKQVLKFTAESVDIRDLHQTVQGPNGTTYHVRAGEGTTSTVRGGTVTMYTEKLEGNLFGVIPQTYDAQHPPPLDVPFAVFTKVKIQQAGQFGGNLTVPGLHQTVENA